MIEQKKKRKYIKKPKKINNCSQTRIIPKIDVSTQTGDVKYNNYTLEQLDSYTTDKLRTICRELDIRITKKNKNTRRRKYELIKDILTKNNLYLVYFV